MKTKILVTAFQPFAGRSLNPALEVLKRLNPGTFANCTLHTAKIPVRGKTVGRIITALITKIKPDCIVALGLAAGGTSVRVERFALNIQDYGIKDNSGYKPEGKKIKADGPAAYTVNSDPLKIAAAIRKTKTPVHVSNHAGTYVCNQFMYEAMHTITVRRLPSKFTFLHLPLTTEMAILEKTDIIPPPSLPLTMLVKAVEAAIGAIK